MRASSFVVVAAVTGTLAAMGCGRPTPTAPSQAAAEDLPQPQATAGTVVSNGTETGRTTSWGPETPPFNLEAVLRPLGDSGFGLVRFRQPNDANLIVYLDVWVRDLAPNTNYSLQRAVDTAVDGQCTSAAWLTLGQGLQPQPITTDASGTGRAALFRDLSAIGQGLRFDIHFRVVEATTLTPALQSGCYEFVTDL